MLFEFDLTCNKYEIAGRFLVVPLEFPPPFVALSYVCGTDQCDRKITANICKLTVRPNLYLALGNFSRAPRRSGERSLVWIDAICIDQYNESEKASQIRSMYRIFSQADWVHVWLGPLFDNVRMVLHTFSWVKLYDHLRSEMSPEPLDELPRSGDVDSYPPIMMETDAATMGVFRNFSILTKVLQERHGIEKHHLRALYQLLWRLDRCKTDLEASRMETERKNKLKHVMNWPGRDSLFPPDHLFWSGVYSLFEVEWFRRVWTYQEVKLARYVTLATHGLWFNWTTITSAMDSLVLALTDDTMIQAIDPAPKDKHSRDGWDAVVMNWQQFRRSSASPDLSWLLFLTRTRNTKAAKDRIYGILALLAPDLRSEITVEYSLTDAEVFANAIKLCFRLGDFEGVTRLWTLSDGLPSSSLGLPSWCPDLFWLGRDRTKYSHKAFSPAVQNGAKPFAYYGDSPGFKTIALRVLKIDLVVKCTDHASPELLSTRQEVLAFHIVSKRIAGKPTGQNCFTYEFGFLVITT